MNWHKDLSMATTVADVIDLLNEYLSLLPESTHHIPEELRPRHIATASQVHDWHSRLTDGIGAITRPNLLLQDLCVAFVRASARIAELTDEKPANGDENSICGCG